ncbi:MAG: transcriptional regulator [Pseudomonadota bacterium]
MFRQRLRTLLEAEEHGTAQFLRDTGLDRSALSQFLNPESDRLPRAEALRRIAAARGISVDWLLGLENAPEGRQEIRSSLMVERAEGPDGSTPVEAWRREAAGLKLRYVPTLLPDLLEQSGIGGAGEALLGDADLDDTDVEIAMPLQRFEALALGGGIWRGTRAQERRRKISAMAHLARAHYPTLRVHLFDARKTFAPAFSVFGRSRVALYLGESYLVLTGRENIRLFTRLFDGLVRAAVIGPDRVHATLAEIAEDVRT